MTRKHKESSIRGSILLIVALINVVIIKNGFTISAKWYYLLIVSVPLLITLALQLRQHIK
jgi:hypothetical protein